MTFIVRGEQCARRVHYYSLIFAEISFNNKVGRSVGTCRWKVTILKRENRCVARVKAAGNQNIIRKIYTQNIFAHGVITILRCKLYTGVTCTGFTHIFPYRFAGRSARCVRYCIRHTRAERHNSY